MTRRRHRAVQNSRPMVEADPCVARHRHPDDVHCTRPYLDSVWPCADLPESQFGVAADGTRIVGRHAEVDAVDEILAE
jgi:hypothetical protein